MLPMCPATFVTYVPVTQDVYIAMVKSCVRNGVLIGPSVPGTVRQNSGKIKSQLGWACDASAITLPPKNGRMHQYD
ncbi:MAG: hypothetical protein H0U71_03220 [Gammaproteobacteria bacterium]|nr:hypothetical protein [Gammaproteobacteria bacterium]